MRQGVRNIYVKILKGIDKESTGTMKLHKVSDEKSIQKGVGQSDTISPNVHGDFRGKFFFFFFF